MSEKYKTRKIGVTALCRVSAKGGAGVYLYIPRHFSEAYGIMGSDFAEVHFRKVFILNLSEESDVGKEEVIDLTSRKKERKK